LINNLLCLFIVIIIPFIQKSTKDMDEKLEKRALYGDLLIFLQILIITLIIDVLIIYYFKKKYLSYELKKLNINYSFNKYLYIFLGIPFFLYFLCLIYIY
jgi:hypothetical protein